MNMSYCRFRNTLGDLRDCWHALREGDELSREEAAAAIELLALCKKLAERYEPADIEAMREAV